MSGGRPFICITTARTNYSLVVTKRWCVNSHSEHSTPYPKKKCFLLKHRQGPQRHTNILKPRGHSCLRFFKARIACSSCGEYGTRTLRKLKQICERPLQIAMSPYHWMCWRIIWQAHRSHSCSGGWRSVSHTHLKS